MMNVMNYQDYDVILNIFDAIEKERMDEAQECLDGKFKSNVLKVEVNREEFLEIFSRIKEGIPDAKFEIVNLITNGESFKADVKISGTHSQTIPSLKKGWKSMKPTGKRVNWVVTSIEILIHANRIREIKNLDLDKGVIAGLLDELQLLPRSYSKN